MMQGQRIESYLVKRRIQSGGFGQVYEAVNERLGLPVAIKTIKTAKLQLKNGRRHLDAELAILQTVSHPNIIKLIESFSTNDYKFIVMEYAEGGDLHDLVAQRQICEAEARSFFRQIIRAMEFCHLNGFAHRDLKLENFVLNESVVKLIDFGLAKHYSENNFDLMKTSCGTVKYIDPELIRARSYAGEVADVWSLGVVLYYLLAGRPPFDEFEELTLVLKGIQTRAFKLPPQVSKDGQDLIKLLLEPSVVKRLSLAEIKCHKWFVGDNLLHYLDHRYADEQADRYGCSFPFVLEKVLSALEDQLYNPLERAKHVAVVEAQAPSRFLVDYKTVLAKELNTRYIRELLDPPRYVFRRLEMRVGTEGDTLRDTFHDYCLNTRNASSEWRVGFTSASDVTEVLERMLEAFERLGVKVDIISAHDFEFKCWKMQRGENFPSRFDIKCYSDYSQLVLQLKNHTLSVLHFISIARLLHRICKNPGRRF